MPEISVIIPVYNAEKYLEQCIDSVLAQTFTDIEVICVDDGSTDSSPEILERYQQQDPRITILHQQNQYAGVARNKGLEQASGKYLVFWDSDDYFKPTALELMWAYCERDSADLCVCGASRYYESFGREVETKTYVKERYLPAEIPFSRETNEDYILNFANESVWNKMFRREFIMEEGIRFLPFRIGEDAFFVALALCLAKRITVVKDCLVCYRTLQATDLVGTLSKSPLEPFQAWMDVYTELERRNAFPADSYARKTAGTAWYLLNNLSDWESFSKTVAFIKEEGLEKLCLAELKDEDFYLQPWHRQFVERLQNGKPEELLAFIAHFNYQANRSNGGKKAFARHQLESVKEKLRSTRVALRLTQGQLDTVQSAYKGVLNSRAYKIGMAVTAPYRVVKGKKKK